MATTKIIQWELRARRPSLPSFLPVFTLCASVCTGLCNAQPVFDSAFELIRQQERQREQRRHLESEVEVHMPAQTSGNQERLPLEETPCFKIHSVEFRLAASVSPPLPVAGSIPSREIDSWAQAASGVASRALAGARHDDSPIGRCLGAQGVAQLITRTQDSLHQQGWVTSRVVAAPQDLGGGTLTLTLIPGRIRLIRLKPEAAARLSLSNSITASPGQILLLADIEQSLENLKRIPTAQAEIQIEPAEQAAAPAAGQGSVNTPEQNTSDLIVTWSQDATPIRLNLTADDSGTKATGKYQGSVTLSLDNPLALSDLFYITANNDLGGGHPGSRGTNGQTVHYSLPLGYWNMGLTHSDSNYFQNVAGLNQTYIYRGTSETTELSLARIVRRNTTSKTSLALKASQRKSRNFIDDTEVMTQRRVTGVYELTLGHKQTLQAAPVKDLGKVQVNLSYKRGTGDFDTLPAPEETTGEGTSRFGLLLLDASLDILFKAAGQSWGYSAALKVQNNTTPLTPQDRFAIGSRYSVRGFDGETLLSAERGWTMRNELSWNLPQRQLLYLGIDYGEVSGPSSDLLAGKALSGVAIGWRGNWGRLQYDFFVSTPLHKPDAFKTASTTGGFQVSLSL
ncbi:MAG: ShlB/FhaC/HecB family hemolysin secretion/activation protein [Burkholderiales bacterium]|nr:ShlB/FhaC/HecB family hemolysin secretion/activation protein [Burkholderiales bacterium]